MEVTVIIPAYNAAQHLEDAIQSVLDQTHNHFELIIINDGSADNTWEIINTFAQKDSRIRPLNQQNQGTAATLNRGIQEARTEWIMVMHADDLMLANRLERQIAFIKENPDVRITACMAYYISENGKQIGKTTSELFTREKFNWFVQNNEAIGILHPGVALHRDTVLQTGGYRQPFWPAEDIDLWNRVAEQGHLILVQNEFLMKYRIHTGSVSTARFKDTRLKYEWVRACMRARRANQPEPSWELFRKDWDALPLLSKLNRSRKLNAKALYHEAAHDCLRGNYFAGAGKLCLSGLMQPNYTLIRLKRQLLG